MARIKIKDLPKDMKISEDMMKRVYGGPNRREHDHIGLVLDPISLNREKDGGGTNYIGIIDIDS
jgi:hypothetical protein